jgi:hypothetical protein
MNMDIEVINSILNIEEAAGRVYQIELIMH